MLLVRSAAVVVSCCGGAGAFSAAAVPRGGPRDGRTCIALRASDDRGEKRREREGLLARREEVLREMKNVLEVRGAPHLFSCTLPPML
jgi:hypothetical protein